MSIANQENEWLELSQRDRDRLKVLHGVIRKERRQRGSTAVAAQCASSAAAGRATKGVRRSWPDSAPATHR